MSKPIAQRGQFEVRVDGNELALHKIVTQFSDEYELRFTEVLEYYDNELDAIGAMNYSYEREVRCRLLECQELWDGRLWIEAHEMADEAACTMDTEDRADLLTEADRLLRLSRSEIN